MNPYDRMSDDFPHGTLEGEHAGCLTADCPATPRCAEVAGRYRSDKHFRDAYQAGLRGSDLVDIAELKLSAEQLRVFLEEGAAAAKLQEAAEAAQPAPEAPGAEVAAASTAGVQADAEEEVGPIWKDRFDALDQAGKDQKLLDWAQSFTSTQIGERLGRNGAGVSSMIRAAQRRAGAAAAVPGPARPQAPESKPARTNTTPAPAPTAGGPKATGAGEELSRGSISIPAGFFEGKVTVETETVAVASVPDVVPEGETRGPRVLQLWALVDADDHLVMASTKLGPAVDALTKLVRS